MKKKIFNLGLVGLTTLPIAVIASHTNEVKSTSDFKFEKENMGRSGIMNFWHSQETKSYKILPNRNVGYDFNTEINKFSDFISSKTIAQLQFDIKTIYPTASQLGIIEPGLYSGTTATYKLADFNFDEDHNKEVTVTLRHGFDQMSKTFRLIPKYNFDKRRAYLKSLSFPKEIKLLAGATLSQNFDKNYFADVRNSFYLTQSSANATNLVDLEGYISYAKLAIKNANNYNLAVLEANDGLELNYSGSNIINDGQGIFSIAVNNNGDNFLVVGGKGKANLGTIKDDGNISFKGVIDVFHNRYVTIRSAISDGKDGYFVGGTFGHFAHIDKDGNVISTKIILHGYDIHGMVLDNNSKYPGVVVCGEHGYVWHVDENGNLASDWTEEQVLRRNNNWGGEEIFTIAKDGHDGYWVGGTDGKIDHILANGSIEYKEEPEYFVDGSIIRSITPDGHDGLIVTGSNGMLDHSDAHGNANKVTYGYSSWNSQDQIITSVISDGYDGYWVGGFGGTISHIDANLKKIGHIYKKQIFNNSPIFSLSLDGHGGLLIVGQGGKMKRLSVYVNGTGDIATTKRSAYDFSGDVAKFANVISKKTAPHLNHYDLTSNTLTADQLGFTQPVLSKGTTVTYSINPNTRRFVDENSIAIVTATLKHGSESATTMFYLKAAYDFSVEKARFTNVWSSKNSDQLYADVHTDNPTAAQLGFREPTLSKGTTATYSLESRIFGYKMYKWVTVTLTHGSESTTTKFILLIVIS